LEKRNDRLQRRVDELENLVDKIHHRGYGGPPLSPSQNPSPHGKQKPITHSSPVEAPATIVRPSASKKRLVTSKSALPPPVPEHSRPSVITGPAAYTSGLWTEVVKRKTGKVPPPILDITNRQGKTLALPLSSSPSRITTRERHLTLRFTSGRAVVLPPGCSAETI